MTQILKILSPSTLMALSSLYEEKALAGMSKKMKLDVHQQLENLIDKQQIMKLWSSENCWLIKDNLWCSEVDYIYNVWGKTRTSIFSLRIINLIRQWRWQRYPDEKKSTLVNIKFIYWIIPGELLFFRCGFCGIFTKCLYHRL